jgi:hypothetical protein
MDIAMATKRKVPMYNKSWPERPKSVKECTEAFPRIPERFKKVEYKTKMKVAMTKIIEVFKAELDVLCAIIVWIAPSKTNQGTKEAFSTGSQFQYPPKFKVS